MFSAELDDTIKMLEAVGLEHPWVQVIFEMPVVYRNADTVETKRLEEEGVRLRKKVFEKL